MSEYHQKRAYEIIKKIQYATLATVTTDGKPWNTPVSHSYDQDLNIYWCSDRESQHSKNVLANGLVFISIYDSTAPEGEGEGVYIEARVTELNKVEEIAMAINLGKNANTDKPNNFVGDAIRRFYKATPGKVWLNDVEMDGDVFVRDIRVEVNLAELKRSLAYN